MAIGYIDQRDLLLPLFSGIDETPLWDTFLRRLLARTRARKICVLLRRAGSVGPPPYQRVVVAAGDRSPDPLDIEAFSDSGLVPYASLRPNRIYSLEETAIANDAEIARRQRELLVQSDIAHARFVRIPTRQEDDLWLILLRDLHDFSAETSALVSSLAPHMALALALLFERTALRLRTAMAEDALALLGVGQAAFDADGHVVAADDLAAEALEVPPNGRLQLRAGISQALTTASRELSQAPATSRRVVRLDERTASDMLLRPPPPIPGDMPSGAQAIGLIRREPLSNAASAARVATATLGLSVREAALAEAMSRGASIVEAGAQLQLTPETARNYSKRIYAKTGATGQADLMRVMLTGLAPFA